VYLEGAPHYMNIHPRKKRRDFVCQCWVVFKIFFDKKTFDSGVFKFLEEGNLEFDYRVLKKNSKN
jgi:hypothetical protein